MNTISPFKKAFSLVELSIVLVILGLLVGGVLAGQSLIRAAELRSLTTEYNKFYSSTKLFRDKYLGLPGDINNATLFWGDNVTYCSDTNVADGNPGTCNGNSSGTVDIPSLSGGPITGEMYQFWTQLALAGLIDGIYTGISDVGGGAGVLIGQSSPASRLGKVGWCITHRSSVGSPIFFNTPGINMFQIGTKTGSSLFGSFLTGQEAWSFDTKVDDGRPYSGKVSGVNWSTCTTATSSSDTSAAYQLTSSGYVCALTINSPF